MNRLARLVWIVTLVSLAATLAMVAPRAVRARNQAHRELDRFHRVAALTSELAEFERSASMLNAHASEPAKLAPAVSAALTAAGLPPSTLANLSPQSGAAERLDGMAGGEAVLRLVRKRATVVLTPLTLPQLGRFLEQWRTASPEWTVSRIDLEPQRDGRAATLPGSDLPLRATLTLESVRVATDGKDS